MSSSRRKIQIMQITAILEQKIDNENSFAPKESDCTLRYGFKVLLKRISYNKQTNLLLHFLSTSKLKCSFYKNFKDKFQYAIRLHS